MSSASNNMALERRAHNGIFAAGGSSRINRNFFTSARVCLHLQRWSINWTINKRERKNVYKKT